MWQYNYKDGKGSEEVCIHIAESLCCIPETTWHSKSTILQLKKKKEMRRERHNDESLIMKEM